MSQLFCLKAVWEMEKLAWRQAHPQAVVQLNLLPAPSTLNRAIPQSWKRPKQSRTRQNSSSFLSVPSGTWRALDTGIEDPYPGHLAVKEAVQLWSVPNFPPFFLYRLRPVILYSRSNLWKIKNWNIPSLWWQRLFSHQEPLSECWIN